MKNRLRLLSVCAVSAVMLLSACGASDKAAESAAAPAAEEKVESEEEAEAVVNPELHYESELFSVDLPESWDGLWMVQEYNQEAQEYDGNSIGALRNTNFYCKECYENYEGSGFVVGVELSEDPPISIEYIGGDCIGTMTNDETGEKLYAILSYPTDVQFDPETQEVYTKMYEDRAYLADTFAPADGWTLERMSYAEVMSDIERSFDGVVISADAEKVSFLNNDELYTVTFDAAENEDLKAVEMGHIYTVKYTGVIMNNDPDEFALVSLENADANYDYNVDAAVLATKISSAVEAKDMDALSEYCQYPVTVDDMVINSAEDFKAMKFEDVFSDELVRFVRNIRLTELPSDSEEISLSILPEYSHILIKNVGGEWKIAGFYNVPTDF